MRRVPLYQVDAFAESVFRGNPAAVCPLPGWLPDETLRAVAAENALSETAFFLPDEDPMPLRWFTPVQEVPLCGHATLAAGFVVLTRLFPEREVALFSSRSGSLTVSREGAGFSLDLPALPLERAEPPPPPLVRGLGVEPVEVWIGREDPNYFAVLDDEAAVAALRPDLALLEGLHPRGVAATAPGESADFVSRYFAPGYGIPEDPVTGSIHCALGLYWADRLGRRRLEARQLSRRGGRIGVRVEGERVHLTGAAACYMSGEIHLPGSGGTERSPAPEG